MRLPSFFAFLLLWLSVLAVIGYLAFLEGRGEMLVLIGGMAIFGAWLAVVVVRQQLSRPSDMAEGDEKEPGPDEAEAEIARPAHRPMAQTVAGLACFCVAGVALVYSAAAVMAGTRSASWPSVQGTITESDYWTTPTKRGTAHRVDVDYEYQVRGRQYSNDRIAIGPSDVASAAGGRGVVARYPEGASVPVRYHPHSPRISMLEPRLSGGLFLSILFIVLPFVIGWGMFTGRLDERGRVRRPSARSARAPAASARQRIDVPLAVRRLFPAFVVTFFLVAVALRWMNIAYLGQSAEGNLSVKVALIWGVSLLGMLLLNKGWLPHISGRPMLFVGIGCGVLSAVMYTYLPYTFARTTDPVLYYFKAIASWALLLNVFPLLPAIVLAASARAAGQQAPSESVVVVGAR